MAPPEGRPEAPAGIPADWPHRACSRRVLAAGLSWHVQVFEPPAEAAGAPPWLLLHGTGASSHSWRALAPRLARHRRVIVPDLPGHAWTERPPQEGLSLPGMAGLLGGLLRELEVSPSCVVGHSAGAAIAARMALDGHVAPRALVGLNGAWLPPSSQGRWFYEPLARMLVLNPVVPHLFAWHAGQRMVLERLLRSTGSVLDPEGVALYAQLVREPRHVGAVLAMMASWDLGPLLADLPALQPALHLVVAEGDRTVPPAASEAAAARLEGRGVRLHRLAGLGHLAHEEAPQRVATLLESLGAELG